MSEREKSDSDGAEAGTPPDPKAEPRHPTGQAGTGQSDSGRKATPDDSGN
jgi:hypothetical protein